MLFKKLKEIEKRTESSTKYLKKIEALAKKIENAEKTDKHIITLYPSEELITTLTKMVENDCQLSIELLMADGSKLTIRKKTLWESKNTDPFNN